MIILPDVLYRLTSNEGHKVTNRFAAITVAVVMWTGGCGYSSSRPFPADVNTVHVEMFQSQVFRHDLEFRLTEAVAKRIEMDTPYRLASRDRADTVLSGELIEIKQGTLGNDFRTDLPRQNASTFVVSYRWQDLRNGKNLVEKERFPHTTTYIRPVGETFFDAAVRGLDGLAERIVNSMESPW
jgi:hypothetical protein